MANTNFGPIHQTNQYQQLHLAPQTGHNVSSNDNPNISGAFQQAASRFSEVAAAPQFPFGASRALPNPPEAALTSQVAQRRLSDIYGELQLKDDQAADSNLGLATPPAQQQAPPSGNSHAQFVPSNTQERTSNQYNILPEPIPPDNYGSPVGRPDQLPGNYANPVPQQPVAHGNYTQGAAAPQTNYTNMPQLENVSETPALKKNSYVSAPPVSLPHSARGRPSPNNYGAVSRTPARETQNAPPQQPVAQGKYTQGAAAPLTSSGQAQFVVPAPLKTSEMAPDLTTGQVSPNTQGVSPRTHQYGGAPELPTIKEQIGNIQNLKAELKNVPFYQRTRKKELTAKLTEARAELKQSIQGDIKIVNSKLNAAKSAAATTGSRTSGNQLLMLTKNLDDLESQVAHLSSDDRPAMRAEILNARNAVKMEVKKSLQSLTNDFKNANTQTGLWSKSVAAAKNWNDILKELTDTSLIKDPQIRKAIAGMYRQISATAQDRLRDIKTLNEGPNASDRLKNLLAFQDQLAVLPGTKTILQLRKAVATDVKAIKQAKLRH